MPWLETFCRRLGLAIHNVRHPDGVKRKVVDKRTQTRKLSDKVTLRRTTIDEIEIQPGAGDEDHDENARRSDDA